MEKLDEELPAKEVSKNTLRVDKALGCAAVQEIVQRPAGPDFIYGQVAIGYPFWP